VNGYTYRLWNPTTCVLVPVLPLTGNVTLGILFNFGFLMYKKGIISLGSGTCLSSPATLGSTSRRMAVQAGLGIKRDPISKITKTPKKGLAEFLKW
jgi:hypothetical protein